MTRGRGRCGARQVVVAGGFGFKRPPVHSPFTAETPVCLGGVRRAHVTHCHCEEAALRVFSAAVSECKGRPGGEESCAKPFFFLWAKIAALAVRAPGLAQGTPKPRCRRGFHARLAHAELLDVRANTWTE